MTNKIKACCCLCKSEVTTSKFSKHYKSKQCMRRYKQITKTNIHSTQNAEGCIFCNKLLSTKAGKKSHERTCKQNPNRITGQNQFTKAKTLGIAIPIVSDETKRKIRLKNTGKKHTDETKLKISDTMLLVAARNPESYSGRYNRGHVKELEVAEFKVLGGWEKTFVEYCISNNILITQPKEGFSYFWEGKSRTYYPDFYLPKFNTYIEIKGYMQNRDICKLSDFPNKIQVIGRTEINKIRKENFDINKFLE